MQKITFQQSVRELVTCYKSLFPNEVDRLNYLDEYLIKISSFRKLSDRLSMPAHITASSVVISRTTGRILLVNKPALKLHLQPGGHIILDDPTPIHAAIRHLAWRLPEKFVSRLTYLQWHYDPLVPMDIDTHNIARSPQDSEPQHTHFDMRYLFLGDEEMLSEDDEIVRKHNPMWKDIDYMRSIASFQHIITKLNSALSPELARKRFYSEVTQNIIRKNVSVIAVAHIIPDVVDYLMSLNRLFDLKGVIAKPKSINRQIFQKLTDNGIPIVEVNRDSTELEEYIDQQINSTSLPVVLMDIGGWFAPLIESLFSKHQNKLIGVVEDTENGHQKYLKIPNFPLPLFSVARSPLKDFEDFLIGKSIVFSADVILRKQGQLLEYLNCSVIGYGKIGKSIAHQLASRGLQPSVYDKQPIRRLEAYNSVFKVPSWSEILTSSDIIFSATGGKATSIIDFKLLKSGCYLFSVTSSDDEFDFSYIKNEYKTEKVDELIEKCIGPTNYFYLVCNGNAVNFVDGACVGDFIQLVRSEMLSAVSLLADGLHEPKIHTIDENTREIIANTWLRTFLRINDLLFDKDRDKALPNLIDSLNGITFS
ncbi:MAG: hypothetical protein HXX14_19575 [Bacteroidetes bacterium]|nr:hypothetical protein [Bacteroidota bacterium]